MRSSHAWRLGTLLGIAFIASLPARADLLAGIPVIYHESFDGETTSSPTTPEIDVRALGSITAFKQAGNGMPTHGFGFGSLIFDVEAAAGPAPAEQAGGHAQAGLADDGNPIGLAAVLRGWNVTLNGDGQVFAGVYFATSAASLAATLQRTALGGSDEIRLVVTEIDVTGGTPRPTQSIALGETARDWVEDGQYFEVELFYDRAAETARARFTGGGVEVDTPSVSPTLLDGVTLSFAGVAARAVNVLDGDDFDRDDGIVIGVDAMTIHAPEPASLACGAAALAALGVVRRAMAARPRSARAPRRARAPRST